MTVIVYRWGRPAVLYQHVPGLYISGGVLFLGRWAEELAGVRGIEVTHVTVTLGGQVPEHTTAGAHVKSASDPSIRLDSVTDLQETTGKTAGTTARHNL